MERRKPTDSERKLIEFLLQRSEDGVIIEVSNALQVQSMDDGGMGSLRLFPDENNSEKDERTFGRTLSECDFEDEDGVKVFATLYLDTEGGLFELDLWKTNYAKIIRIPDFRSPH